MNTWKFGLLCLAWLLAYCQPVSSANQDSTIPSDFSLVHPEFERVGDAEAIPFGVVTALAQDHRGLIWIGTQNGLIRYDGYRFRKFVHEASNPHSLPGDYVVSLLAARDGRIWVGTNSHGLAVFDPRLEQFARFATEPKNPNSLSAGVISALLEDSNGGIWVATNEGLDFLAVGEKRFRHFRPMPNQANSLLDKRVRSLLRDKHGRIWIGTASGLQRLNVDGQSFENIASNPQDADSLAGQEVITLFEAQDGKLWLGTHKHGAAWLDNPPQQQNGIAPHLHRLMPGTKLTNNSSQKSLSHGRVTGIAQPRSDQIWLATYGGGVNIVAPTDGRVVQHLRHDPALANSLAFNTLKPLLLDHSGMLWLGTWGGGLQRIHLQNQMVQMLRHSVNRPRSISFTDVTSMLELANGQLLFGTDGNGVDIFDRKLGLVGGYRRQEGKPDSLPDNTALALMESRDGSLWVGTQQTGVARRKPGSTSWEIIPGLPSPQVNRLLESSNGTVWAATSSGLARWDAQVARFTSVPADGNVAMQTASSIVIEDGEGRIWLGTDGGLWVIEPGSTYLRGIRPTLGKPSSISSDYVTGLLIDSKKRLWVATDKGLDRLLHWDGRTATFERISDRLGLSGKGLGENLLEDNWGRIWTDKAVFDPKKMQIIDINKGDGLDLGTAWVGSYGKTRDGLLLMGGTLGVALIDPAQLREWDYQPPVVLTGLTINGKTQPPKDALSISAAPPAPKQPANASPARLTLSPHERHFAIEFSALDYSAPKKNRYRYRLLGYDQEWIETDAERRSANYGNLWPGEYVLQIQGSNRVGKWSESQLQIGIVVLPAIWQTWWFLVLSLLTLIGCLFAGLRWRTRRLTKLIAARTIDIEKLAQIGRELTATLDTEQAFDRVYKQVSARLDAFVFSIGVYDEAKAKIVFLYQIEEGIREAGDELSMHEHERPAVWCVRERRELVANTKDELLNFVKIILPAFSGVPTETIVYLPLVLEQKVIGCLSVQSRKQHAYDSDQLEFLRVLASYTAIAVANSAAHSELASSHDELSDANRHLQETQAQLIQSEKMASLGQLVSNVAHEINTPIGAIKASGHNIADALEQTLNDLPLALKMLNADEEKIFNKIIVQARNITNLLSSREERAIKREVIALLNAREVTHAEFKADILSQMLQSHAPQMLSLTLPLLTHPQADFILQCAHRVTGIISNTSNINLAVRRIGKIVFALKAYARSGLNGEMMEAKLEEELETVLTLYQSQIKRGVELLREFNEIPAILCWPDELNQVWTNLIHNALQAMHFEGTLTLRTQRIVLPDGSAQAVVEIADSGSGIPADIREKIFDAFFTTKPRGEGSGLGLDIVKKIVEKHQGRIEVQSEIGVGSCFSVYLPYPPESEK